MIDWVSPLRPDRTDIAEYSYRVQSALQGHFPLNLIEPNKAENLASYLLDGDSFFNIGNDAQFHGPILRAIQRYSGILVAHDYRIQDLIIAEFIRQGPGWEERYQAMMSRIYGLEGRAAARQFCQGRLSTLELAVDFPGIELAAERALCIVTHNPLLAVEIAERTGLFCTTLPLPFPIAADTAESADAPLGVDQTIDLLMFGYIGDNREVAAVCELLSERRDPRFRLHVAGAPGSSVRALLDSLPAKGTLIDHGFVPEHDLNGLIRSSALVINLRDPTMGEVSGSQLRIFANRGLSVVTDHGWYSSLPDNCVLKVKPGEAKKGLNMVLQQLVDDPSAFKGFRERGFEHVREKHSLERFADAFHSFMTDSSDALHHGRKILLADRIHFLHHQVNQIKPKPASFYLQKAGELV